jgi:hypothetical protein
MRAAVVEIPHINWETQRKLELDKSIREAVRDHIRARWPNGTAKEAARAYRSSVDQAREACAGRASLSFLERIIKRGGPSHFLPIMEQVWGGSIARYWIEIGATHEEHGRRLAAVFGVAADLGADRPAVDTDRGRMAADGRRPVADRTIAPNRGRAAPEDRRLATSSTERPGASAGSGA